VEGSHNLDGVLDSKFDTFIVKKIVSILLHENATPYMHIRAQGFKNDL